MPLRSPGRADRAPACFSQLAAVPARAGLSSSNSAGRRVMLPDRIARGDAGRAVRRRFSSMRSTPDKLIGWAQPLSRAQRALLPAKFAPVSNRRPARRKLSDGDCRRRDPAPSRSDHRLRRPIRRRPWRSPTASSSRPRVPLIACSTTAPPAGAANAAPAPPRPRPQRARTARVHPLCPTPAPPMSGAAGCWSARPTQRPLVYYGRGPRRARNRLCRGRRRRCVHRAGGRHQCRGRARPGTG